MRNTDKSELHRALGARAARIRRERGWTQERLAEEIGVAAETISRWETGHRGMTLVTLATIGDALGVSLGDLLDVEREVPTPEGDPLEQELVVRWRGLGDLDRERVVEIVKLFGRGPM